nr:immunoglobulin light chain junction region [Macaca mulatta]MOV83975.1 immunoglobulin light chain junction region [Macaca mulatta]MOV85194.1 immunoglobulin light chain junction region [Macaca mulatta]
CQQYNALPLTF